MVREDLVEGAVTFLQDPSVAAAPLEQRVNFLRSKNLTQEEIDASLARAGQSPNGQSAPPATYQQQYRGPPQQYGGYQQYNQWGQPPPELPRRDWRDWFIAATVVGGVGYAMYWTAKRYVYPLIAPPTPPQLEQDKAHIDASFDKAFALLDQLATDTQELKDSEKARTERLDQALAEIETVVASIKEANNSRDLEARRTARELSEIRDEIPRAIEKEKETTENRLKDLATEMKSLKTLVGSRMGSAPPRTAQTAAPQVNGTAGIGGPVQSNAAPETNGVLAPVVEPETPSVLPERSSAASPYGRTLGGKAQIPSWQLAAKKRTEEAKKESGSVQEVPDASLSANEASS